MDSDRRPNMVTKNWYRTWLLAIAAVLWISLTNCGEIPPHTQGRATPRSAANGETGISGTETVRLGALLSSEDHLRLLQNTVRNTSISLGDRQPEYRLELVARIVNSSDHIEIVRTICHELVPHGVHTLIDAVFGGSYMDNYIASRHVTMTAGYLGLPIIGVNQEMTCIVEDVEDHNLFIQIGSSISQQVAALLAFLEFYHWYHFAVITSLIPGHVEFLSELQYLTIGEGDDHDSSWEICETFEMHYPGGDNINEYPAGDNVNNTLRRVKEGDCQIIILFASHEESLTVFRTAKEYGLLKEGYIWLVLELSFGGKAAITSVPADFPVGLIGVKFERQDYFMETALEDAALMYARRLQGFLQNGSHIELADSTGCYARGKHSFHGSEDFFDRLRGGVVPYKDFVFDEHGAVANPRMALLNLDEDRKWREAGMWYNGSIVMEGVVWLGGKHNPPKGLSPHRHMKFTTIIEEPFVFSIPSSEHEGTCEYGVTCVTRNLTSGEESARCCLGFCIDLLEQLKRDIGFTYDLHLVEDNNYGAEIDGQWNGMIGDIVSHEADAAIGAVRITTERADVVDFSTPFISTGISVLVKRQDGEISNTAFLGSFHITVWVFLLVVAVNITAIFVFVFEWFSPGGYDRDFNQGRASKFTLGSSIWLIYGILFNNTVHNNVPRSYTAKFMTNMWACFALVFVAMYTADLVTHMIQEDTHRIVTGYTDKKIQNPTNFQPPLKFATVVSSSVETLIKKSNPEMHNYMKTYSKRTSAEAIKALKIGELDAFIYDSEVLNALAKKDDHCDLIMVGDVYASTGYAVAFSKESHWIERFDDFLLMYKDNGFVQKLSDTWMDSTCDTKGVHSAASRQTLRVENFAGVFYLLIAGILVSIVVFTGEHICLKCCTNTRLFRCRSKKRQSLSVLVQIVAQNMSMSKTKPTKEPECHNLACLKQCSELRQVRRRIRELEGTLSQWSPYPQTRTAAVLENGEEAIPGSPVTPSRGRRNTYAEAVSEDELVPLDFTEDTLPNNVFHVQRNRAENFNNFTKPNHKKSSRRLANKQQNRNAGKKRNKREVLGGLLERSELIPLNPAASDSGSVNLETTV
ncbi:glutamate receptor ionotropic, NMDA 2A-like [Ptychodera flava]|uniref:glutamate receptor ionotropic, NMDA 2A-like n=1 Tax=Ptychodera flava TaxID=63121 RepID=UPI00396A4448